ncbi:MAG: hypothetical protein ACJA1I_000995 [Zhongshania marina]|uniref:Uncharacterized protein n=1 Tax=Zhongshania marina TaxID=2304603 RepID=A0ABX9W028_9GAMM|nr:hypothetical protein D0911_13430 [Zhongshania marina]
MGVLTQIFCGAKYLPVLIANLLPGECIFGRYTAAFFLAPLLAACGPIIVCADMIVVCWGGILQIH